MDRMRAEHEVCHETGPSTLQPTARPHNKTRHVWLKNPVYYYFYL